MWGREEVPGLPSPHSTPGSGCSPTHQSAQRSHGPESPSLLSAHSAPWSRVCSALTWPRGPRSAPRSQRRVVPGLLSAHSAPWSPFCAEEQEAQRGQECIQVTQLGEADEAQSDVMGPPGPRSHGSQGSGPI